MRTAWLFIAGVIIIPMLAFSLVSWYQQKYVSLPFPVSEGHIVKGIPAINQESDTVDFSAFGEKSIKVVNLFFTRCPVVCPKMMKNLLSVHDADDKEVVFCSYSVDPERDSAMELKQYSEKFNISSSWYLFTGSKQEIYRFARKDLLLLATDGDGGELDFIHSENVVLVDFSNRIRGYYKGTDIKEIERLSADIIKLKKDYK